ncbi:hypothetical protein MMC26_001842 [Xylographa opegraphella]|nr:hypothetical protein [Xylographa opegraphella]
MGSLSFALVAWIFAQLSASLPQVNTPIPITNSAPAPTFTCGGCYVVADVAGIEFGTETITQTRQGTVSIGLNYTTVISSTVGNTQFTVAPTGILGPGTLFNYGTAFVYSSVTLTSPTAYDVFTAYSITSTILTNGACSVFFGTSIPLTSAFNYPRPLGSGSYDEAAEQAFIDYIFNGLPTCLPGGINSVQSTVTPVVIQTSFSTITRALPTPQPITAVTTATPSLTTTSTSATTSSNPTSTSSLSSSLVSSIPSLMSTLSSSSSISSLTSTSPIFLTPFPPVSLPTTTSSPISSQATTTLTSTISLVAVIPVPSNTTTLTSTISVGTVIIVGNSTLLPTGNYPNYTIIPVTAQAANWRTDTTLSWRSWVTGFLSTLAVLWAF